MTCSGGGITCCVPNYFNYPKKKQRPLILCYTKQSRVRKNGYIKVFVPPSLQHFHSAQCEGGVKRYRNFVTSALKVCAVRWHYTAFSRHWTADDFKFHNKTGLTLFICLLVFLLCAVNDLSDRFISVPRIGNWERGRSLTENNIALKLGLLKWSEKYKKISWIWLIRSDGQWSCGI